MAKREPTPYTVEMMVKPLDRAEACPEQVRCQLQVIKEDKGESLHMVRMGQDSMTVQVGMTQASGGCDYRVEVGMAATGGPIAVGGGGVPALWETKLIGCIAPQALFLPWVPRSLINVRYRDDDTGELISLIVAEQDATGNWQVVVDRVGVGYHDTLRLDYADSKDDLVVTAALSPDYSTLYIAESRLKQYGDRATTWHWYTFDPVGRWSMAGSALVPKPTETISSRPQAVGRDGVVRGYWAMTSETDLVQDWQPVEWCYDSPAGYHQDTTTRTNPEYFGGGWNIGKRRYDQGDTRGIGVVISSGDMEVLVEQAETVDTLLSRGRYAWENHGLGTSTREQFLLNNYGMHFNPVGLNLGRMRDAALYEIFSAEAVIVVTYTGGDPQPYYMEIDYTFDTYQHHDGADQLRTTYGGWVTRHTTGEVIDTIDLSPYHFESAANQNYIIPCPGMLAYLLAERVTFKTINEQRIVYPVDLGEYYAIDRSFAAHDQVSGESYYGIMYRAKETDQPSWRIWDGGRECTQTIANCIGHPLSELGAIYWRA